MLVVVLGGVEVIAVESVGDDEERLVGADDEEDRWLDEEVFDWRGLCKVVWCLPEQMRQQPERQDWVV